MATGDATQGDESDKAVTTESDYRWKGLSTIFALLYGIGFPAWAVLLPLYGEPYPPGTLMGVLVLAWGGTVVYIIGPENVKAFKNLKG
jgi:hypothetical protein